MEAELIQLAREAVVALRQPNWAEMAAVWIGVGQILVILGGLWLMNKASNVRNRQLDQQGEALRQQGEALRQQGEVLAELLRRTDST